MEYTLDIFRNDGFTPIALQRVVDNEPFVPQMLGQLGLFDPEPLEGTDKVMLYEEDGNIRMVPITQRGEPDSVQKRDVGRLRVLETLRLAKQDSLRAGELWKTTATALPESIRLRNATDLISKRLAKLHSDLEATKELHRFGAIQGKILDVDGSVAVNFFTEYGIADPTAIDINFGTTTEDQLQMFIQENFEQPMVESLNNRALPGVRIVALAGNGLWGKLMRHPAVREIWKAQQTGRAIAMQVNPLAKSNLWESIWFAGIEWVHWRGMTGGQMAVPTNQAILFPVGATDVFKVFWAPGETLHDVDKPGKSEYPYIQPDTRDQMPEFVDIFLRSYPLYACIYPQCLMRMNATG